MIPNDKHMNQTRRHSSVRIPCVDYGLNLSVDKEEGGGRPFRNGGNRKKSGQL